MGTDAALRDRFLAGMSHAAQTVNVVTTDGPAGRAGVTVSAMTSVSADTERPTLLVCIHHESTTAAAIRANHVFCVNVLRDDQSWISDTFAGRFRAQVEDKFEIAGWLPMPTGAPRVVDPLVAFDCRLVSSDLVGTHHVFFGEVGEIYIAERGSPLIYARRSYGAPARIEPAASIGEGRADAGNRLLLACLQTISAVLVPDLLRRLHDEAPEITVSLIEGDHARLHAALGAGEAELALTWDQDVPADLASEPLADFPPHALLPEGHRLAAKDALLPGDFAGEPMVLLSAPPAADHFEALLREQGVEATVAYRAGSLETVRGLVGQGLGCALLDSLPAGEESPGGERLVRRPLAWAARPRTLVLVRRRGAALSPAAARFARLCRASFAAGADQA